MDQAELCVVPVWASLGVTASATSVDHNGTGTLIDTGRRKILVTARHVIVKVREVRAEHPEAGFAVNLGNGTTPFFPEFEVIDEDADLDLAVVSFPHLHRWTGHTKRYFPVRQWPIPVPRRGDAITIVGFPGCERRPYETFGSFSPVGIGMVVSNEPGRHIVLADESGTLTTYKNGLAEPGGIEPGGMSGSAGFFFQGDWFHLAGFVYEGRPGFLFLAPGASLSPEGTITHV